MRTVYAKHFPYDDDHLGVVIDEMKLNNVEIKYTGGKKGWKGDVPIVRLDISAIRDLEWNYKYNSKEAVKLATKSTVKKYESK